MSIRVIEKKLRFHRILEFHRGQVIFNSSLRRVINMKLKSNRQFLDEYSLRGGFNPPLPLHCAGWAGCQLLAPVTLVALVALVALVTLVALAELAALLRCSR